jgi:hypothetical protein
MTTKIDSDTSIAGPTEASGIQRPRAAIYSMASIAGSGNADQIRELRVYAEERGWDVVGDFSDVVLILEEANKGRIDIIICWSLDQLPTLSYMFEMGRMLRERSVRLIAFRESVDTRTESGRLLTTILQSMERITKRPMAKQTLGRTGTGSDAPPVGIRRRRIQRIS